MKPHHLLFLFFLIAGCTKPSSQDIKRVDLATEGITISIDSSLNYKCFQCNRDGKNVYYKGRVNTTLWDSLNQKLGTINLDKLKSADCLNEFDPGIEIMEKKGSNSAYFTSNLNCLPVNIKSIFYWIINTHKHLRLVKSEDTLTFNVKSICPPVEKKSQVKFPLPSKFKH